MGWDDQTFLSLGQSRTANGLAFDLTWGAREVVCGHDFRVQLRELSNFCLVSSTHAQTAVDITKFSKLTHSPPPPTHTQPVPDRPRIGFRLHMCSREKSAAAMTFVFSFASSVSFALFSPLRRDRWG